MNKKIAELHHKAQAGNTEALCSLAMRYFHGRGLKEDKVKALKLFNEAADQGYPFAISILKGMKLKEVRP